MEENDYSEYLKALESRIYPPVTEKPVENADEKASVPVTDSRTRRAAARRKRIIKRRCFTAALLFAAVLVIFGSVRLISAVSAEKKQYGESASDAAPSQNTSSAVPEKPKTADYAKYTAMTADPGDKITSRHVIVIDKADNTVVAARDAETRAYPASTTKIMTLITAVGLIKDYNDTFTMTLEITDPLYEEEASVAGFLNGETVNMYDLLYGLILPSGADAAVGLAVKLAGSEDAFVALMNKKISEIGLTGTHFTNVSGLYNEQHYSTAHDMAIILETAIKDELCRKILSTYQYTTSVTPQHPEGITLSSTLFSYMYGTEPEGADIKGGKTGYVDESGYCIAAFGSSDYGKEYIAVIMGGAGKWPAFYDQINLFSAFAK